MSKTSKQYEKFDKLDFIKKIKDYANKKSKDLQQVERILKEQHLRAKQNFSEKYKETIQNFASQKFLKDVNIDFLKKVENKLKKKKYTFINLKLVDINHQIVDPIFKVFEMTKDKEDFLENLKLTYKVLYKGLILLKYLFFSIFLVF